MPLLAESDLAVHAFDQRGWGRSVKAPREKGLTGKTSQVLDDITTVVKTHLSSSIPTFLMGHSMGGQETLYYASKGPEDVKKQLSGFIAMAPWIRLSPHTQPNRFTVVAGRMAANILPHLQQANQLDETVLSHDTEDNNSYKDDLLCHNTYTLEGMSGSLDRAAELDAGEAVPADHERFHLLVMHGTEDAVTDSKATKEYVEKLKVKDKTLKLFDGCFHNRKEVCSQDIVVI